MGEQYTLFSPPKRPESVVVQKPKAVKSAKPEKGAKKENYIANIIGFVAKEAVTQYIRENGQGLSLHNTALEIMNRTSLADSPNKSKYIKSAVDIAQRIYKEKK